MHSILFLYLSVEEMPSFLVIQSPDTDDDDDEACPRL